MNHQIEPAYQNLKSLLAELECIRTALQRQDFYKANNILKKDLSLLEEVFIFVLKEQEYFSQASADISQDNIMFLLNSLLSALDEKEYVLLADVLAQSVLPFLYALQEHIVMRELSEPIRFQAGGKEYQVEYTSCGLPTIKASKKGLSFYLHSNRNARQEAREIAAAWIEPEKTEYIIYGMGLGYAVTALLEEEEYATVKIFESDAALLELSRRYGDYDRILESGRAEIKADESCAGFFAAAAENPEAAILFFYPSLRLISDHRTAEQMENLFISQVSQKTQYPAMQGNFRKNMFSYDEPVDALKSEFCGKRVYLVAGGPSLDKNCDCLKEIKGNGIIVAVGTVLKKLLNKGIRPDYVAVSDAKANTFRQVEGICEANIPMWGLSTAYYRFFSDYHAKHYLVCQEGFAPAEQLAKEKGYFLIQTCGSVIAVALGAALQLGAAEIVFVGLDLAYTGGKHHAEGIGYAANQVHGEQRMAPGVDGELVQTGKNLDIYRKFIEQKIAETKGVWFVDATEGGAKIEGTLLLPLKEVVSTARLEGEA